MGSEITFHQLGPESILSSVEKGLGLRASGRILALNSMENRVYEIEVFGEKSSASYSLIAKFYRPGRWSEEQILEEHDFIFDLLDAEIPVVAPLLLENGSSLAREGKLRNSFFSFSKSERP